MGDAGTSDRSLKINVLKKWNVKASDVLNKYRAGRNLVQGGTRSIDAAMRVRAHKSLKQAGTFHVCEGEGASL